MNTNVEPEHLVRTVEYILKLRDYATMVVCVGFRYLRGALPSVAVLSTVDIIDKNMSGWLWSV